MVVSFALVLWWVSGLAVALDTSHPATSLLHTAFRRSDGAPSGVSGIAQTEDGQIWLSTRTGLYRYDGFDFTKIDLLPPDSPRTHATWSIYAARGGDLWVALVNGGAARLQDNAVRRYGEADGLPPNVTIDDFAADGHDRMWALVQGQLYRFDGLAWAPFTAAPSDIDDLSEDGRGNLWVASEGRWLVLRDGSKYVEDVGVAYNGATSLLADPKGRLWMLDRDGAKPLPGEWGQPHTLTPERRSNSSDALIDRDGTLWSAACYPGICHDVAFGNRGAGFVPRSSLQDHRDLASFPLTSGVVMTTMEDRDGNLWFGTKGGIDLLRNSVVSHVAFSDIQVYFSPVEDRHGQVWTGTDNRSDSPDLLWKVGTSTPVPVAGFEGSITMSYADPRDGIWLGGHGQLWNMKDGQLFPDAFPPPDSGAPGVVQAMGRDGTDRTWLSVAFQGLYHRDGNKPWEKTREGLPGGSPSVIYIDPCGAAWLGYLDGQVVRANGASNEVLPPGVAASGAVTAIATVANRLYVASERGFTVLAGTRFVHLDTSLGDVLNGATGIVQRSDGTLWVNTEAGLVWFRDVDVERALASDTHRIDVSVLDADDGVQDGVQFVRPLPSALAAHDGTLWFARAEGLMSLPPGRLPPAAPPPVTVIRSIVSDGRALPLDEASLQPDHREFVATYAAIAPARSSGVHFRYRLGADMLDWHPLGRQRELRYTQMHPGTYRLVVEASYDGRHWGDPAEATIIVVPTFVEGPWFKLLCIAMLGILMWVAHRMRVRRLTRQLRLRLRERYEERERIARELHDTLLQGALGLILRFQVIVDRLPSSDPGRKSLEQAIDRAERLVTEGRDRVQSLRERHGHAGTLLDRLQRYAAELETFGVQVTMHTRGSPRALDPFVEDELYFIGREALLNVQRHADARSVYIEMVFSVRRFTLLISDDGKGLPSFDKTNDDARHWGLTGIRERAARIGGRAHIWSRHGKGTELRVEASARRAYRRG